MGRKRISGCVYARPPRSSSDVRWGVAPDGKTKYPRDLTVTELLEMQTKLVGVPVRVEHKQNRVGVVASASVDPETGYTTVEMDLDDCAAGWAAGSLVESGKLRELSLNHACDLPTSKKWPVEVSLCAKGAREDTVIFGAGSGTTTAPAEYKCGAPPLASTPLRASVMASAQAAPATQAAAPPAPAQTQPPAPAAPAPTPAAPAQAAAAPAEAAKPADAPEPPAEGVSGKKRSRRELLEDVAKGITDEKLLEQFWNVSGSFYSDLMNSEKSNSELTKRMKTLEAEHSKTVDNQKNIASEVAKVLSDLYDQYAPGSQIKEQSKWDGLTQHLAAEPAFLQMLQPLQVAASAMRMERANTETANATKAYDVARNRALELERQLATMTGEAAPAAAPPAANVWAAPPPAAAIPPAAPVVAAPPAVHVAASGAGAAAPVAAAASSGLMPDWLRSSIGQFDDTFHNTSITPDNFQASVRPKLK